MGGENWILSFSCQLLISSLSTTAFEKVIVKLVFLETLSSGETFFIVIPFVPALQPVRSESNVKLRKKIF